MFTETNDVINNLGMASGMLGLFSLIAELLSIFFVWMLLQEVKWESFFRFPRNAKARMLQVVLSVAVGHMLAQFILQYWGYTLLLKGFVE
ncbi:DUF1146 domain-containing protein [Paenibacillus sp. HB172176]|uniref:DUF1146 family protein n=1 Tax=Paenibacillus sp. HB172176 TaxID=2493690 RepID=UPI00143AE3C4|nr:DUF1146 domain-containing protein [Paenibacillus sp. HB172176]